MLALNTNQSTNQFTRSGGFHSTNLSWLKLCNVYKNYKMRSLDTPQRTSSAQRPYVIHFKIKKNINVHEKKRLNFIYLSL